MYGSFCPSPLPPSLLPAKANNYVRCSRTLDDALVFVDTEEIPADLRRKDAVFILAFRNITTLWRAEYSELKSLLDKKSEDLDFLGLTAWHCTNYFSPWVTYANRRRKN